MKGGKVIKQDRQAAVGLIEQLTLQKDDTGFKADIRTVCRVLGISPTSYYRWKKDLDAEDRRATCKRPPNPLAYSEQEQQEIANKYCEKEVCDMSVERAYFTYLDKGEYYCSPSTARRVLRKFGVDGSKRRDNMKPANRKNTYRPPESIANAPNEVWSYDATPYGEYNLFVAIDIYSRKIVGWHTCVGETSANAVEFLTKTFEENNIQKGHPLRIHSDNGPAMRAEDTVRLLNDMELKEVTHSRSHVSDDNPYSESVFATLNIRLGLDLRRYHSLEECREACAKAIWKYNNEYFHKSINYVPPAIRHEGAEAERAFLERRKQTLEQARAKAPQRWVKGFVMNCEPAGPQVLNPTPRGAKVASLSDVEKSMATDNNRAN